MSKMSPQLWFQRSPCTADNRAWHKPWDSFDYRWGFYPVPTRWRAALSPPRVWWRSCFKVPPFDGRVVVFFCFQLTKKPTWKGSMAIATPMYWWKSWARIHPYPNRHLLGVAIAIYFHYGGEMVAADVGAFFLEGKQPRLGRLGVEFLLVFDASWVRDPAGTTGGVRNLCPLGSSDFSWWIRILMGNTLNFPLAWPFC